MTILRKISEWQENQFPENTVEGCFEHICQEIEELRCLMREVEGVTGGNEDLSIPSRESARPSMERRRLAEEFADIIFMANRAINRLGLDTEGILQSKLEKNKKRRWPDIPDKYGMYKHIKEIEED